MISKVLFMSLVLLLVCLVNYYPEVEGRTSRRRTLSKDGATRENDFDLELKRQLKFFNKPPIKTINEGNGDIFDCVNIHKQPALDHPLLKNHKIQMRPDPSLKDFDENKKRFSSKTKSKHSRVSNKSIFKPLGCPKGTVPIRRTSKEDLLRAKPFFESYNPSSTTSFRQTSNINGQHVAIRRSKLNETYYGVYGWINLANPSYVLNDQFSAGQVWVEGGPLEKRTTLQAGWAVSPELFQDNKTRLFAYSNADINPQGCYNILCQGFVQTNKDIAFGHEFTTSVYNDSTQEILAIQIYKADNDGSWWLAIGEPEQDVKDIEMKDIGYWPGEIYSELVDGASYIAWGGMVKGNSKGQSPSMGNGYAPEGGYLQYTTGKDSETSSSSRIVIEVDKVLLELARNRNKMPLPKSIAGRACIPLPPDEDTLISPNYQLVVPRKPPPQAVEETEEDEDAGNPTPNPNPSQEISNKTLPKGQPFPLEQNVLGQYDFSRVKGYPIHAEFPSSLF